MIEITDKSKCCGCTACYSICPKNAIQMISDNEGFIYPRVDDTRCIDCGICDKVCPIVSPYSPVIKKTSSKYAVQNLSENERKQSTAGGFFSIIARYIIEDFNGIVFAVGFDGYTVVHKSACSLDILEEMRGSKYVQSNLGNTFIAVRNAINEGIKCLFVGTPCQVNGIEKFLRNSKCRENLITVDLLCLGVSSPKIYEKWVEYLQFKYNDAVKRVYFRDKSYGYSTANVRVCFETRKPLEQCYDAKSLLKTFFTGYNMRPSCYDCSFRCLERGSDFTIGDFHQIGQHCQDMDDDKGTTCVWAHSENAQRLIKVLESKMKVHIIEDSCSSVIGDRSKLTAIPDNRGEFFDDVESMTYPVLVNKWAKNDFRGALANFLKPIINKMPLKTIIFKAIKKNKQKKFQQRIASANKVNGE
ncbi:MAG: Coenzyme F420 hydrogenase/dehydrogenase, beta subunit C-terminal domain [Clostridia bacterium]|nr:Coenzyme F420 hydrogenase/dehydrogenase, beta subunit C-terminal domain [Clostridia bacterium]